MPTDAAEVEPFFAERWPDARVVCDPERAFYRALAPARGSLLTLLHPGMWWRALRSLTRGHGVGRPKGDVWTMPGTLLVHGDRVLFRHQGRHFGDHPDLRQVTRIAAAAATA